MDNTNCDPKLTDDYINRILAYLEGWTLEPVEKKPQEEYASSFLEASEIEDAVTTTNTISRKELAIFFQKGKSEVMSYMWWDYIPRSPVVHEALILWTAGLIWKKYNVIHNFSDNTVPYGYGDQLIKMAKKTLKNSIRTRLRGLV